MLFEGCEGRLSVQSRRLLGVGNGGRHARPGLLLLPPPKLLGGLELNL